MCARAVLILSVLCLLACGGGGGALTGGSTGSTTGGLGVPGLGAGVSLNGKQVFPSDNPWNQRVDTMAVDSNSDVYINSIGRATHLHPDFGSDPSYGIPYIIVAGTQPRVAVSFDYASESDPGPYPIPSNAPIEGGTNASGDRHVLVIDRDAWKLYEMFAAYPQSNGTWHAGSGAVFDLNSNALRPAGWTSADAAGLPIFPGLVRYDEVVEHSAITHAIRFTVPSTQRGYIYPARHFASNSSDPALPPMGMRVRLKASVDISAYPPEAKVIAQAMKTYGMLLADNGSAWYFTGMTDTRWDDTQLNALKALTGNDLEVVQLGSITTGKR